MAHRASGFFAERCAALEESMVTLGEDAAPRTDALAPDRLGWLVLDALRDATAVVDQDGVIIAVNATWESFRVVNGGDVATCGVGADYLAVCAEAAARGCHEALLVAEGLRDVLAGTRAFFELEYRCPSPDEDRWFLQRITPLPGREGAVVSHVNITRRKQAELILAENASRDPLTGLLNRGAIEADDSSGGALLFIDLDHFKAVNDRLGHAAGDEVLARAADRILHQTRPGDRVIRFGGDEFVVILTGDGKDDLETVAARIEEALSAPYQIGPQVARVRASVGLAHRAPGETAPAALARADAAMFEIKRTRRARRR